MIDPDGIGVNEGSEAPRAALVDAGAVSFRKGERYTVSKEYDGFLERAATQCVAPASGSPPSEVTHGPTPDPSPSQTPK